MGRSPASDDAKGLKKGPWTTEEDEKLVRHIQQHGHGSWRALPKLAGLNRCGKSCRLRWTNYLKPEIKRGKFSEDEEQTILRLHSVLGNKWSSIASHLPGRTDNEIKNFWNTHLKKKLVQMGFDPMTHQPRTDHLLSSLPHLIALANLKALVDYHNQQPQNSSFIHCGATFPSVTSSFQDHENTNQNINVHQMINDVLMSGTPGDELGNIDSLQSSVETSILDSGSIFCNSQSQPLFHQMPLTQNFGDQDLLPQLHSFSSSDFCGAVSGCFDDQMEAGDRRLDEAGNPNFYDDENYSSCFWSELQYESSIMHNKFP